MGAAFRQCEAREESKAGISAGYDGGFPLAEACPTGSIGVYVVVRRSIA
ncbi:hypothetical protein ACT3UQ_12395 [Glutamicibacter sp. AOP12-B1-11]